MKKLHLLRSRLCGLAMAIAVLSCVGVAKATPFASCITNDGSGNMTFYLNEGGGTVTVTYEDSSIATGYNGVSLAAGPHQFSLSGHTSYTVSVAKVGTGVASLLTPTAGIARSACRGVAANTRGASPYFGYVYSAIGGAGVVMMNSDGSGQVNPNLRPPINGGVGDQWSTTYAAAECYVTVCPDDYVLVCDFTGNATGELAPPSSGWEGGIIRVNPNFTAAQLLLPNLYNLWSPASANGSFTQNHGTMESRAILSDSLANNPNLYVIDGSGFINFNQIVVYSNISAATVAANNGWPNQPDYISSSTVVPGLQGNGYQGYFRAGLALGNNGYLYVSQDRANLSDPNLQVWNTKSFNPANTNDLYNAYTYTNANLWPTTPAIATNLLWCSYWFTTNGTTVTKQDYTVTGTPQLPEPGTAPAELALSPDNKYLALVHDDSHVTVFTLTNGVPDISTEYLITGLITDTSTATSGRYIGWDAAGNLWVANRHASGSPANGRVHYISLGRTATATTTGNASGTTGFNLVVPDNNVSVMATVDKCARANSYGYPTTGKFTFTRTGNTSSPLAIFFDLAGTQYLTNGTFTTSAGTSGGHYTVTIPAGQASVDVTITPTDTLPRPAGGVLTATVVGPGNTSYNVGSPNVAKISVINVATPVIIAGAWVPTMYRPYGTDYAQFYLSRWGDTNVAITPSGYTYGGTAVAGQDYTTPAVVPFAAGATIHYIAISPRDNGSMPVHTANPTYVGDKTIAINVASGSGYNPGSSTANLTILDDAYPPATVLYSDPLTAPVDGNDNDGSARWNITAANADMQNADPEYYVDFGFDLTSGTWLGQSIGAIPLPPSGASTALRVAVNKLHSVSTTVNLYPTNWTMSGDYAVRFNMNLIQCSSTNNDVEGPLFGINHSGTLTNWFVGSDLYSSTNLYPNGWLTDGIFAYTVADRYGGSLNDYELFTGLGGKLPNTGWMRLANYSASTFANAFKHPNPFSGIPYSDPNGASAGTVANGSPLIGLNASTWADVEIKQVANLVTVSINHTPIWSYQNTNSFTSGTLMLGLDDWSSGSGSVDGAVYFSNLKVVSLVSGPPVITGITASGGNVMITFTSPNSSDTPSSFTVVSSGTVNGTYGNVSPAANITQNPTTHVFTATTALNGPAQFYRIKHN